MITALSLEFAPPTDRIVTSLKPEMLENLLRHAQFDHNVFNRNRAWGQYRSPLKAASMCK
jgi:hypothetical protein